MKNNFKRTNILKSLLIVGVSSTVFISSGMLINSDSAEQTVEAIKAQRKVEKALKEDGTGFEYKFSVSGGTSSAMVATVNGVEHVFGWGNNELGQLGVGSHGSSYDTLENNSEDIKDVWGASFLNQIGKDSYEGLNDIVGTDYLNEVPALPTPEDINIDGGAAGIQGEVLDVIMGDATTYVEILNDDGLIDIYATGSNVYGQLGVGEGHDLINTSWDSGFENAGYRPSWEKLHFYDDEGVEVVFQEILSIASVKSTFVSGIDTNGNNRVFAWGFNGTGMLGTGKWGRQTRNYANGDPIAPISDTIGDDGTYSSHPGIYKQVSESVIDTPTEITQNFLLPDYTGTASSITLSDIDETYGYGGTPSILSPGGNNYNDSYEVGTLTYPFETQGLNEGGWKITNIKVGKIDTIFEATNESGKKALLTAGNLHQKYPEFIMRAVLDSSTSLNGIPNGSNVYSSTLGSGYSSSPLPLIWYWDEMDPAILFDTSNSWGAGQMVDGYPLTSVVDPGYANAESIELIDFSTSAMNNLLALRIDGRDHLISWNWSTVKNRSNRHLGAPATSYEAYYFQALQGGDGDGALTNAFAEGNGYMLQDSMSNSSVPIVSEVNLGYNSTDTDGTPIGGLREGDEIIKTYINTDKDFMSAGALIKTKADDGSGKDIYSIVSWGSNRFGIINPDPSTFDGQLYDSTGVAAANDYLYRDNSNISLTTATSAAQVSENQLLDFENLNNDAYARTIDKFLVDPNGNNIYEPTDDYIIKNIIPGGTTMTIIIEDTTTGSLTRYYYGNNESQQISSEIPDVVVIKPTSLFVSSAPLSDSFTLNFNTVKTDGIDFSIDIISGGEFETFTPVIDGTEASTLRFFGDLNGDGTTITSGEGVEEIGVQSGSLEYIGRGVDATGGTLDTPTYNTDPISEADQLTTMYSETYNFRIHGLESGTAYPYLYVQVNGHNPIAVDGILQTEQKAKFSSDLTHMELVDYSSDYFTVKTELLYDVPGYEALSSTPTADDFKANTVISFEDQDGNVYSNDNTVVTGSTQFQFDVESVGTSPNPDQELGTGETPVGQDVTFTISGGVIEPGKTYNNFKLFYDLGDLNTSVWEDPTDSTSTTIISSDVTITTKSEFVLGSEFSDAVITDQTAQFSFDIQNEVGKEYLAPNLDTLKVTADQSINGGTSESVELNATATLDDETGTVVTVVATELRTNATYSNVVVELSDADAAYHTTYTTTTTDSTFTFDVAEKAIPATPVLTTDDITLDVKQNSATVSFQNDSLINVTEDTTTYGKTITNISASSTSIGDENISTVSYDVTTGAGSFTISNLTSESTYSDLVITIDWSITKDHLSPEAQTAVVLEPITITTPAKGLSTTPTITSVDVTAKEDSAGVIITGSGFADVEETEEVAGKVMDDITVDLVGTPVASRTIADISEDITVTDTEISFTILGLEAKTDYTGSISIDYHNVIDGVDIVAPTVVDESISFTTKASSVLVLLPDAQVTSVNSNTATIDIVFEGNSAIDAVTKLEDAVITYNETKVDSKFISVDGSDNSVVTYEIYNLDERTEYSADGWNYTMPDQAEDNTYDFTLQSSFTTGYIDEAFVNEVYGFNVLDGSWGGTTFSAQVLFEDSFIDSNGDWRDDISFTSNGQVFSTANENLEVTSVDTTAWEGMTLVSFNFSGLQEGATYETWEIRSLDKTYLDGAIPAARKYDETEMTTTTFDGINGYTIDDETGRPIDVDGNVIDSLDDLGNAGNIIGTIDIDGDGNDDLLIVWPDGTIQIEIDGDPDNSIIIGDNGDGSFSIDWPSGDLWGIPEGPYIVTPDGDGGWTITDNGGNEVGLVTDEDGNLIIVGMPDGNLIGELIDSDGDGTPDGIDLDGDGEIDIDLNLDPATPDEPTRKDNEAIVKTEAGLKVQSNTITETSFNVEVTFKGNVTDPNAEDFQNVQFSYNGSKVESTLIGVSDYSSNVLVYEISGLNADQTYTQDGWMVYSLNEDYLDSISTREYIEMANYSEHEISLSEDVKTMALPDEGSSLTWLWIILVIILILSVVGALLWFLVFAKKGKESEDEVVEDSKSKKVTSKVRIAKEETVDPRLEAFKSMTKAQLMKLASEIYDKDSLKEYTKDDLVELLMNEGVDPTQKEDPKRAELSKMTKAQLMKQAAEIYDKDSLKEYTKDDLVELLMNE